MCNLIKLEKCSTFLTHDIRNVCAYIAVIITWVAANGSYCQDEILHRVLIAGGTVVAIKMWFV